MESLQQRIHREQRMASDPGQVKRLTYVQADGAETYAMSANENIVVVTSGHSSNTCTVTLPPVDECVGQQYIIIATAGGTATTTVEDNGNDGGLGDITLDGNGEYAHVLSLGDRWIELSTVGHN